jgi:retron-type reverse transcriptase
MLSNIFLHYVLDLWFEKKVKPQTRGACQLVCYADDCNIYVRSGRAGRRVMESVSRFITRKLKLKVNQSKSKVDRPCRCKFL